MPVIADCTLLGPQAGVDQSPLFAVTRCGDRTDCGDAPGQPTSWRLAYDARGDFERKMYDALSGLVSPYPVAAGSTMLNTLGWNQGASLILDCDPRPAALRLTLTDLSCRLLPEMVATDASGGWLDTALPVFRTLSHVNRPMVNRLAEPSLAILYQNDREGLFEDLARRVLRNLPSAMPIDDYPGNDLIGGAKVTLLQEIFFRHRAILFLGHLARPENGQPGGWCLSDDPALPRGDRSLPLSDLRTLLGNAHTVTPGRVRTALPIPELVLTGCCCGAWGDPGSRGATDLFYPEIFLAAGVRYFVGSWADVVVRGLPNGLGGLDYVQDLERLAGLLAGFLSRWSNAPDQAVEHLYEAKKCLGFPLVASLFQIYTAIEPVAAVPAVAPAEPPAPLVDSASGRTPGALVASIVPGMQIGPYALTAELWRDPYAVAFWAQGPQDSGHILQVLADPWQDEPGLADAIDRALAELAGLGLSAGHLVPDRRESLPMPGIGDGRLLLEVLVYDRPADERLEDWQVLRNQPLDPTEPNHYQRVLGLGAQTAAALTGLHAPGLLHGNLDPGSLLIRRDALGPLGEGAPEPGEVVRLKDAWVQRVRPGRCTDPHYAAPEEPEPQSGPARLKQDCWGLGVVLYELATGQPPEGQPSIRAAVGSHADLVPEALERVVRECLVPSVTLRPSADVVAARLLLAYQLGGTYLEDVTAGFDAAIRAGHRLFAVEVDQAADIERLLDGLQRHPPPGLFRYSVADRQDDEGGLHRHPAPARFSYRLYIAAEDLGIIEHPIRRTVLRWKNAREIEEEYRRATGRTPAPMAPSEVAAVNGAAILDWARDLRLPPGSNELPVMLIHGAAWWQGLTVEQQAFSWRVLKQAQAEKGYPVVIVADGLLPWLGDAAPAFLGLDLRTLPPTELFERLLAGARAHPGASPPDPAAVAAIADRLYPCGGRDLDELLRLCVIHHGCIDERILALRERERGERFDGGGIMHYVPSSDLPTFAEVGWPPAEEPRVTAWAMGLREAGFGPRRLLIHGGPGCGKRIAAEAFANEARLPLIRLEASRCLRSELGGSENSLHLALSQIDALGAVAVLLDDIDRFAAADPAGTDASSGTLARMGAILRSWIERLPPRVLVLATVQDSASLPIPWQRLFEERLAMDRPALDDALDPACLPYREAVFRAVLRRIGLTGPADDDDLVAALARETHPGIRKTLPSPLARRRPASSLGTLTSDLNRGAAIAQWVTETVRYRDPDADPEALAFWYQAIK
jgi:hypothetical protein